MSTAPDVRTIDAPRAPAQPTDPLFHRHRHTTRCWWNPDRAGWVCPHPKAPTA